MSHRAATRLETHGLDEIGCQHGYGIAGNTAGLPRLRPLIVRGSLDRVGSGRRP